MRFLKKFQLFKQRALVAVAEAEVWYMNCMLQQWTITAHVTVDAVKIQSNVLTPSDSSEPAQPAVADKHIHACPPVLPVQTTETSYGE